MFNKCKQNNNKEIIYGYFAYMLHVLLNYVCTLCMLVFSLMNIMCIHIYIYIYTHRT